MAIKPANRSNLSTPLPHLVSHLVHGLKQWLQLRIKVGTQFLLEESWGGHVCAQICLPGWSSLIGQGLHSWFVDIFWHFMDDQLWRMVWRMVSDVSGWVTKGSDDVMMFCWCFSPGGVRPGPVLLMVLRLRNCGGRSSKSQSTPGNGDLPYFPVAIHPVYIRL